MLSSRNYKVEVSGGEHGRMLTESRLQDFLSARGSVSSASGCRGPRNLTAPISCCSVFLSSSFNPLSNMLSFRRSASIDSTSSVDSSLSSASTFDTLEQVSSRLPQELYTLAHTLATLSSSASCNASTVHSVSLWREDTEGLTRVPDADSSTAVTDHSRNLPTARHPSQSLLGDSET